MCGIAGLMHRRKQSNVGHEMTLMLQSMKHRGPDSTGFAVYGPPQADHWVLRLKLAEQKDLQNSFGIHAEIQDRQEQVCARLATLNAQVVSHDQATPYAFVYRIHYDGDLRKLVDAIEDNTGTEILSIGKTLELIKDLGDAQQVAGQYELDSFVGTHAIGHVRMATESDVDISSAHPYWACPFNDTAVVHNGQLTNYWTMRRGLERQGYRFTSNCDSELIAVYIAHQLENGTDLERAMHNSINELDGVFTYLVSTGDSLGMAKDVMSAKPMVLYESDDTIIMASEEVAIRSLIPTEINTTDPYAGEVRVWQN